MCTCSTVEDFEIIHQVVGIVGAGESDLEGLVSSDEWGQPGQALLARTTHTYQECIASISANDAWDLDKVHHGIFEEYQVHACTSDHVIVLLHVGC